MSQLFSLFNSLSCLLYTKPEARISVLHYIAGIFPQLVPVHICAYMYNLLCYSLFGRRDVRSRGCLLEMPPATPRSWLLALNVFWCLSPAERLMIPLLQDSSSSSSQIGMVQQICNAESNTVDSIVKDRRQDFVGILLYKR